MQNQHHNNKDVALVTHAGLMAYYHERQAAVVALTEAFNDAVAQGVDASAIEPAYNRVRGLIETAAATALGAATLSQTLKEQRDASLAETTALEQALRDPFFSDDPRVSAFVEIMLEATETEVERRVSDEVETIAERAIDARDEMFNDGYECGYEQGRADAQRLLE